ncbi:hypothetical protein J4210_05390 [Candidatus Woesearchaeota archaeon]|nr:hypothetical protein [Candidatus Woesearchaeota archaeon]
MALNGKYVVTAVLSALVGFVGGMYSTDYFKQPTAVYVRNLNYDTRTDLIIEDRAGERTVFLQMIGGDYMCLDEYTNGINKDTEALEQKIKTEAGKIPK